MKEHGLNAIRTASPITQSGLFSSPSRLLGEDYAPARSIYLTHIPAILVLTGLVTWIAGDEMAMVMAAAVASLVACYLLWEWLFREGPTRFSTILAMTLLLGYGLGAVNTWLTLPRGDLPLPAFLGLDEGVLARGMAAVLLSAAVLCFLGELYERPLFGREFRIPLDQPTYSLIYLGTLAIIIGYFTHSLDYGGVTNVFGEQQSVASALLSWILPPLAALAAAVFLASRKGVAKLLTGICTLILCVLLMTTGRRMVIYTAMEIIFALRLTGYRVKGAILKRALLVAALAGFVALGITVLMLLRLAANESGAGFHAPLSQRIQIAMTWVEDGTALKRATEANQANVQRRTFVLGFFSDVLEGSSRTTPALGRDLLALTSLAVPRVLNPDKDLYFSEEGLVDEVFGLTYRDAANSIITGGATDFGLPGVILYPLFMVCLMRFLIEIFARFLNPLPVSIVVLGAIFMLLQTEGTITTYWVTIRNEILFSIILLIFSRLPVIRLRS
jgi:hypothetical protein